MSARVEIPNAFKVFNMSDNPQSDEVINEEVNTEVATNDSVPHSEGGEQVQAESNEQVEQVDEVALAKQKANEAFNKQYGEKKQLERELAQQREQVAKFQQAEREREAAQYGNIPDMPSEFDFDDQAGFLDAVKRREDAIRANERYTHEQSIYNQQQQFDQQQAAQAAQAKQAELANSFTANAKKTGATDEEFNAVVATLNDGGMTSDVGMAIMSDPDGYYIAKHLAEHPMEAHELNTMNPILAGARFAELRQKASALKPKTSSAPSPATNLQGNGVDPEAGKYAHIKGAKFE